MGVYERLGVRRIINATCHWTAYGGTVMWPEVVEAMADARRACVDMRELLDRAGAFISRYTHAEASFVTSGCAAGLQVGAAAMMTGDDKVKMEALPHTAGLMKHEFVARRFPRQRTADGRAYVHWGYAHAVRGAGGVFVEVGGPDGTTRQEFEAALGPNTAGVYWVSDGVEPGLQLAEVSQIAHAHGVPVLVDASNTLPPPEHLYAFVEMGADLVAFSGGKGLRGPQGSGILTGRADLIRAARLQSAPVQGIGRPMKVSKEEIVGLLTALEIWANLDHAVELRAARRRTDLVVAALDGLPGVRAEHRFPDHVGRPYPTAFVRVDPATGLAAADAIAGPASPAPASLTGAGTGLRAADVIARLLEGEPPIAVMGFADPQVVRVDVRILSDEEAAVVARRLREVLSPPRHHHRHLTCNNGRGPPPPGAAPHVEARAEARCLTFLS